MRTIKETTYKGTRILVGNQKRELLNAMISMLLDNGFEEISIPILQYQETFRNKVGQENNNLMFNFKDRGNRDICLAPEYTAIIQKLSQTTYKHQKDIKLFYIQECFRGEQPQAGRYRQFTQLGVEVINPQPLTHAMIPGLAQDLIEIVTNNYELDLDTTRGLDYYIGGRGFEIRCPELGASKQVCGGGDYEGGIGFAIGIDRLLYLLELQKQT